MLNVNRRFISTIMVMFLLFIVILGDSGCGGGHSSNLAKNDPDDPTPTPDTYFTVTFDSNGGSLVANQTVREGEKAVEPNAPVKENFIFGGWYSNIGLTERFSFNTPITSNITLYARWNAPSVTTYTVTFNSNGGSSIQSQNVVIGEQAVPPANPTREGYSFDVWCSDEELTEEFSFDTLITDNITLYARWRALFTVSFNTDGGSEIPAQTVLEYAKAELPENPIKEGYTFLGWNDEEGNSFIFDYEVIFGNTILTAEWGETLPSTENELASMKSADIVGEISISFDTSPVVSVDVEYVVTAGTGIIGISPVLHDPMLNIPGLIGNVLSFHEFGDESFDISEATIKFKYNPDLVKQRASEILAQYKADSIDIDIDINDIDINDFSVYYYDASDDIVKLLGESIVDTTNNTVSVSTNHFCNIGLVLSNIFNSVAKKRLPAVRTDTTPYYDVVMALDYSGSMSYSDIQQSIAAAQGLVDILADDDYVSIIAFATYASAVVEHKRVGDGRDNIKQSIPSNPNVGGGTSFENALSLAKNLKPLDALHQSLVILLSDGGSSISDTLLQELKNNDQKVITVGIGSGVNTSLMQKIAENTGGSYIFSNNAEDLQNAFLELQSTYIGSTKDTDKDGLPDLVEISGMRDQYGKIWRTDPNKANTDGDEFSDGDEMGEYQPRAEIVHFKRKSNPLIPTKETSKSEIRISDEMLTVEGKDDNGYHDNTITVMIDVYDCQYKLENGIEYLYSPAKNVTVNIVKYPDNVMTLLSGWPITITKDDLSDYKHYVTYAKFSYAKDFIFSPAIWEINADGTKYQVNLGGLWERPHIYKVRNGLLTFAESCMKQAQSEFINAMQKKVKTSEVKTVKPEDTDEFKRLKEEIQNVPTNKEVAEEFCAAFALALLKHVEDFNLKEIDLTSDTGIWAFISNFFKRIDESVTYNGNTYTVKATLWGGNNASLGAKVTKSGQKGEISLDWVSDRSNIEKICTKYAEALKNLNDDNWSEFLDTLRDDLTDLIGMPTLSDAFIFAFCNDDFSWKGIKNSLSTGKVSRESVREVMSTFEDFLDIELVDDSFSDYLDEDYIVNTWKDFKSSFIPAIKTAVEGGDDFIKSAGKINEAQKKLELFEDALKNYSSANAKNTDKAIERAWGDFKSAYEAMGGTGIFGHWVLGLGYFNDRIRIPSLDDYH